MDRLRHLDVPQLPAVAQPDRVDAAVAVAVLVAGARVDDAVVDDRRAGQEGALAAEAPGQAAARLLGGGDTGVAPVAVVLRPVVTGDGLQLRLVGEGEVGRLGPDLARRVGHLHVDAVRAGRLPAVGQVAVPGELAAAVERPPVLVARDLEARRDDLVTGVVGVDLDVRHPGGRHPRARGRVDDGDVLVLAVHAERVLEAGARHVDVAEATRRVVDRVRARHRLDVLGGRGERRLVLDVVGVLVADQDELRLVLLQHVTEGVVGRRRAERDVHRLVGQHDHFDVVVRDAGGEVVLEPVQLLLERRGAVVLEDHEVPVAVVERVPLRADVLAVVLDPVGVRRAARVLVVADGRPTPTADCWVPRTVGVELRLAGVVGEVAADRDEAQVGAGGVDLADLVGQLRG